MNHVWTESDERRRTEVYLATQSGAPATPQVQVLVVERNASVPEDTVDRFKVSEEAVIIRITGLAEIQL